jgi:glyceraldehyde 3-phosphate dehydrogenase
MSTEKKISVTAERNPIHIKWAETPDVVIESTVFSLKRERKRCYGDHLKNGAKKVLLTVP